MPLSKCSLLAFTLVLTFVPVLLLVGASEACSGEEEQHSIEWASTSMLFWHPGETKVEDFYVKNRGGLEDSYWLSIEYDVPSWSCSLDRDNLWNVSPGETEIFNASITAPLTADAGDYVNITLTAGSMTVNISDSLSLRAFIIVERAITLRRLGEEPLTLSDDLDATLNMFVKNIGDVPSEVGLSAETVVENELVGSGLTVVIEPTTLALEPGEIGWFTLYISIDDASLFRSLVEYRTHVRAVDTQEKGVWDGKAIPWYFPYRYSVTFSPEEDTFPAVPGVDGTLYVEVDQVTNHLGDYVWDLHLDNQKLGWVVRPDATSIGLKGTAKGVFAIVVTSPVASAPGETLELRVALTCPQRPEDFLNVTCTFEVGTIRLLTIQVTPDEMDLDHGAIPVFSVVLSNHGNVWQGVELGARFGDGTQVSFTDSASRRVGIPPLNRTDFNLTLVLDLHLRPGANVVEFWAEGEDLGEVKFAVVINVPERIGLTVSHSHSDKIALDPNPPDDVVSLTLANTGNVQLALALDCQVAPALPGITLHPVGIRKNDIILLGPGEMRQVDVVVNLSASSGGVGYIKNGTLRFAVSHWGGEKIWAEIFIFDTVAPDLTIARAEWDGYLRAGQYAVALVTVEYVGTSAAPMTFLSMSGSVGPDGTVRVPVPPLDVGEDITLVVQFLPRNGTNTYTFEVDSDGDIIELGVTPNMLPVQGTTESDGPGGDGGQALGWPVLTAVVIVAIAGSMILLALRRRR